MKATQLRVAATALCLVLSLACTASTPRPATSVPDAASSLTAASSVRTPASGSGTAAAAGSAAPPGSTPVASAGQILLQSAGGGAADHCCTVGLKTSAFTAPGSWDLNWSYDCTDSSRVGNLSVDVFAANDSFISDPRSLFVIGSDGQGVQSYTRSGSFTLVVNSVCHWSLTVFTSARPTATPVGSSAAPAPTLPAGLTAALSVPTVAGAAATTAASQPSRGLQALQPSIPTPRAAVPAALGAFSGPGAGAVRVGAGSGGGSAGASTGGGAGGGTQAGSASAATAAATATPPRAATPAR